MVRNLAKFASKVAKFCEKLAKKFTIVDKFILKTAQQKRNFTEQTVIKI